MKKKNTRFIAVTAMLSAVAFVLQYLEIPIPIMPPFIKLDLSDLPALIGSFSMGPLSGVLICLIKNILHMPLSSSGCIGELSNFLLGAAFVLPAGLIYKYKKTKAAAIWSSLLGAVTMAVLSVPINYCVVYPVYIKLFFNGSTEACVELYQLILPSVDGLLECLLVFNMPFTLVKALISVVITVLVYKKLSPILKGAKK